MASIVSNSRVQTDASKRGRWPLRTVLRDGEAVRFDVHVAHYDAMEDTLIHNGVHYQHIPYWAAACSGSVHKNKDNANYWRLCRVRDTDGYWVSMKSLRPIKEVKFPDIGYAHDIEAVEDAHASVEECEAEEYKAKVAKAKRLADPFRAMRFTSCLTNVNELVNSELYVKVAVATGESVTALKREYSPQEMRGVLLQDFKNYYEGPVIVKDCVSPKKPNRGVTN